MKPAIAGGLAALLAFAAPIAPRAPKFSPPYPAPAVPERSGEPTASSAPTDLAFGAYQRGFYLTAFREAMKRLGANPRDAAAMTLIGEIYNDGYAIKADSAEAARWYRLASNLGDREAAFALGALLLNGATGVDKDRAAAQAQFQKGGGLGQAEALYDLGVMAIEGEGNEKPDFAKAADYFRRAAEAGDDNGAYSYGVLLREGR